MSRRRLVFQLMGCIKGGVKGLDCVPALKALGEETRLRMLRLLAKDQLGVNEISERLGVTQYNASKHLRILREAGLLEMTQSGKNRLYTVTTALKTHLEENNSVIDLGCCTFRFDKLPR